MEELEERPFLRYLMSLSAELLDELYDRSQACVSAVFRILPPIAQKCFLYLLYQSPDNYSNWRTWAKPPHYLNIYRHLVLLQRLNIIEGDIAKSEMKVNVHYRMSFLSNLLTDPFTLSQIKIHTLDDKGKKQSAQDILKKSVARWECILCHLAMPSDSSTKEVSVATRSLFQYAGLSNENVEKSAKEPEISSSGFQFLLLNRNQQIWLYLINYLKIAQAQSDEHLFSIIEFLLRLSLCITLSEDIRSLSLDADWNESTQNFVATLRELGLIFIRKRKDGWFIITPLMNALFCPERTKTESTSNELDANDGFLIVETNFRVYAYTNSTLQIAILSTFTELIYRFHDLAIGLITRESVRRALQTGITAKQIVQYLKSNAHPQTSSGGIPSTIIDQIYLWEQERKRVSFNNGVLYSTFKSDAEYEELRNFALEKNAALWYSNDKRVIVVQANSAEIIKNWWRSKN